MKNKNSNNQTPPGGNGYALPGKKLNTHTECGCYDIEISHSDAIKASLPIEVCSKDHYIKGHLLVCETGTHGSLQTDRTIGQTLIVNACGATAPEIYRRSGTIKNGVPTWSKWASGGNSNITWSEASHIDMYTTPGILDINGERTSTTDGLPIYNTGTISARLAVLQGGNSIAQVLTLLNSGGGDSNIYVRTRQGNTWNNWGKLQTNIEVGAIGLGQSRTFDDLTDNGIYSGANVYSTGTGDNGYPLIGYEAFVLVVINAYLTGGGITQLKYSLLPNGTTSVTTRTSVGGPWGEWVDLGAATTTDIQDGAITAQKLSIDIRTKVESPLRPLYITAGAEYNDSGADKTKTAPWGETVTHKAGHYYLNGLGDITEEQMTDIYNSDKYWLSSECIGVMSGEKARTNIPPYSNILYKYKEFSFHQAFNETNIEVLSLTSNKSYNDTIHVNRLSYLGQGSKHLKRIVGVLDASNLTQNTDTKINPPSLTHISIINLSRNFSFYMSPNLSKDSVVYMISNAAPTSAITITLHPDAYARLADDAEIVAALEAQPLVSLVSA